jgi:catechol 2,3-dioxygenase-like lactoylglutathione lyase family enzyme
MSLPALKGVHHAAYRCRDAEETRAFYQDILGLPLKAALVFEEEPGTGRPLPYMHLFFEFSGGSYIAFFDIPNGAKAEQFSPAWGMERHIAMEVATMEELQAFKKRLREAGVGCFGPIDHHFVQSIYFYDPNGLNLEITVRTPTHDQIMAEEGAQAAAMIKNWSERTREAKEKAGLLNANPA